MSYLSKKVLYIDLKRRSFDIKSFPELHDYIGGLPLALKLGDMYIEEKPLIFAIGPLNGFFPFVSKTCVLNLYNSIDTFYIGGSLSSRIRFAGFDSLVIVGQSDEPLFLEINMQGVNFLDSKEEFDNIALPGRSSRLLFTEKVLLDGYFESANDLLEKAFAKKLLGGLTINATSSPTIEDNSRYGKLYKELLSKGMGLHNFVKIGEFPSCVGCPLGCEKSKIGEIDGNILVHTLVACEYMSNLYSDLGIVFSCLNVLGYDYKHEDLEKVPALVANLLNSLEKKI